MARRWRVMFIAPKRGTPTPGPQQLAKLGFYHNPCDERRNNVCCFTCGSELSQWDSAGSYTTEELLEQHEEDRLWVDMLRDLQPCLKDLAPRPRPSVTDSPSPVTNSSCNTNKPVDAQPIRAQLGTSVS